MIYLDNAATTGKKPDCVIQAVTNAMTNLSVNAGRGSYSLARQANQIIEDCRALLLKLAGITSGYHVFFSPSATVSMNQIIHGMEVNAYSRIYVSPFEHNAVMRPIEAVCQTTGAHWYTLPFQRDSWTFDAETASSLFNRSRPDYVFVSFVSNTTGYVLPVKQIVELAHHFGAKVIVDCAQAFGAIDANLQTIGADAYAFAGHKTLLGPYGIAGIILSDKWPLVSGLQGGTGTDSLNLTMPPSSAGGLEPGSPNIAAICGLKAAVEWLLQHNLAEIAEKEKKLINSFVDAVSSNNRVYLYIPPIESRSSIVAFNVEGYESHDVGEILDDEFQIGVRTGNQCAPLVHTWLGTKEFGGIVRLSVSWFNTEEDISKAIQAVESL